MDDSFLKFTYRQSIHPARSRNLFEKIKVWWLLFKLTTISADFPVQLKYASSCLAFIPGYSYLIASVLSHQAQE
jgi:hypothetical protein